MKSLFGNNFRFIEPTVRLDLDNEPQPDTVLRLDESVGGKTHLTPDGYLEGAPELVAEIAAPLPLTCVSSFINTLS